MILCLSYRPDGEKKAYVRLGADFDALDVANRVSIVIWFTVHMKSLIIKKNLFAEIWLLVGL